MGGLCGGKTQVTLSIPYHPERLKSTRRYYQEITCIEDLKTCVLRERRFNKGLLHTAVYVVGKCVCIQEE